MINIGGKYNVREDFDNILTGYKYDKPVKVIASHRIKGRYYVSYFDYDGFLVENGSVREENLLEIKFIDKVKSFIYKVVK